MINFLHTFNPSSILVTLGPITIYWYGFFVVLGMLLALLATIRLAKYYNIKKDLIFDLFFWLVIGGIIGARIYDVFLFLPYYIDNPWDVFKIWQGGLAIHGGIIAGLIIIYFFARKHKLYFWKITSLLVPGLALAQAVGRWGNYFNQELFGLPTSLSWGIPISLINRPLEYVTNTFFHPTFLYESLGNLLIFVILITLSIYFITKKSLSNKFFVWLSLLYMVLYSILRLMLEFIRLDATPAFLLLRWPQVISVVIIIVSIIILIFHENARKTIEEKKE